MTMLMMRVEKSQEDRKKGDGMAGWMAGWRQDVVVSCLCGCLAVGFRGCRLEAAGSGTSCDQGLCLSVLVALSDTKYPIHNIHKTR